MTFLPFIALALLALSGLLIDAHRRAWNAATRDAKLNPLQLRAERAQYLRRIRASGTIGLVGALLIIRPIVPREPLWYTLYLLLLVLLCGLMLILALVDGFAASLRRRQARHQTRTLEAKLKEEIQAARKRSEHK